MVEAPWTGNMKVICLLLNQICWPYIDCISVCGYIFMHIQIFTSYIYKLIYPHDPHVYIYIEVFGHNVYEGPPCRVVWFTLRNIKGVKLCVCMYLYIYRYTCIFILTRLYMHVNLSDMFAYADLQHPPPTKKRSCNKQLSTHHESYWQYLLKVITVGGQNPAPPRMIIIPLLIGF